MSSLLSLGFEYQGTHHSFLARVKENGGKTEYHITVMNDKLEKLLSANNIIMRVNGELAGGDEDISGELHVLRSEIANALSKYLHEKSLTSY